MKLKNVVPILVAGLLISNAWSGPALAKALAFALVDDVEDGIALYREGKFAEAEARLRQATGTEASAYLAASLAKQKKYAEAEAPALAALKENPTHAIAVGALGEAFFGLKRYDEAIEQLSAVVAKEDDVAYAYFWRGKAYDKKNQAARMVADYEMFIKLAPKAPEAPAVQAVLAALR